MSVLHKIQIVQFYPQDIGPWFIRAETECSATRTEDDDTQFYSVFRAFNGPAVQQIADVIGYPPAQAKYNHLKCIITEHFDVPEKEKAKYSGDFFLGSKKPS
ncbi:unnamed protein product [Hermetia illucens]|uniref:DUF7041 domain-containing protein n=1 Tax=Hermetia illucens TaxID=343691 RepID=A0A7R8UIH5_HERIL|nr:unnamed protein product [Hermetia illucens]